MDSPRSTSRPIELVVQTTFRRDAVLSSEDLARAVSISVATLHRLIRMGLVEPDREPDQFTASTAARLERMLRLHDDLEVDLMGAAIIVDLLDRLERMEAAVRRLRHGEEQRGSEESDRSSFELEEG
jgi:DNA-binding transcriptional MerR regulator